MNHYIVTLDENGGEYEGNLEITSPHELEIVDDQTIKIGETSIKWEESILRIEKVVK